MFCLNQWVHARMILADDLTLSIIWTCLPSFQKVSSSLQNNLQVSLYLEKEKSNPYDGLMCTGGTFGWHHVCSLPNNKQLKNFDMLSQSRTKISRSMSVNKASSFKCTQGLIPNYIVWSKQNLHTMDNFYSHEWVEFDPIRHTSFRAEIFQATDFWNWQSNSKRNYQRYSTEQFL